jgi:murein DD-endopeptidase MepM/ murein hydrolase activator NlpD
MTVRTSDVEKFRGHLFVIALTALVSGCATPHTHFDWGVRESAPYQASAYRPAAAHHPAAGDRDCSRVCPITVAPRPRPAPAWYDDKPDDADSDTQAANAHFIWPLHGRVISEFGRTISGARNDGINIAASDGEPIHAAADGIVTYAGNDLKSYGNLALIRHAGDYVTAYAHADRFLVSRGDHVAKGQVIGYAGSTGDVSSPQLHFEIRRGVEPVNPRPLLGPLRVASR